MGRSIRSVLTSKLVRVEGIDQMLEKIATLKVVPAGSAKRVAMPAAKAIADEARDLVYHVVRRRTGALQKAIFVGPGDPRKPDVLVGVNNTAHDKKGFPYAHVIEYGSSTREARPFMRPAIRAARPMAARMIAEGLRSEIESALGGHYRPSGSYDAKPRPASQQIGSEFA